MILDKFGTLVREQNPEGDPGRVGSSCADTSRYRHLSLITGIRPFGVSLDTFVTNTGFIDHPNSIWREDQFNADSCIPFLIASEVEYKLNFNTSSRSALIKRRIIDNIYKTGDGKYVNPGLYFLLYDNKLGLEFTLWGQEKLFEFPYRWSDSKKWFEPNNKNPADYPNYVHMALYLGKSFVSKKELKQKIREYWQPEPNVEWLIQIYDAAINLLEEK